MLNKYFIQIFKSLALTLLILFLSFYLRFYKFDTVGFWGDEYLSFWLSEPLKNFDEIFNKTRSSPDLVPPFYYYLLNLYNYVFGYSAYSLRLFHIFFGFSSTIVVFFLSKFILSKPATNLVLFLFATNVFLIWCSTEARVVSVALFFQILLILIFFNIIKEINNNNSNQIYIILLIFNVLGLTIHPLTIIIILSQLFFLFLMVIKKNYINKKKIFFYIFGIILSCIIYIIVNKKYFISSLGGTRLGHNQLTLNFFLGYNFKHYFSSYFIGFINLLLIGLSIIHLRRGFFNNLYILYLLIIFLFTYGFIIFGTLFFTGLNGPRYWSYLIPIIILVNTYYLTETKKNIFSKIIIVSLIIYAPINYFINIDRPQVRKPDTPGLIKTINESNINFIVSDNYDYFEHYLKYGYKNFNKKIVGQDRIKAISEDFWYLCLDLSKDQTKGSYWNEMYNCEPSKAENYNFKRLESLRFNGYVITKYRFTKNLK